MNPIRRMANLTMHNANISFEKNVIAESREKIHLNSKMLLKTLEFCIDVILTMNTFF